MSKEELDYRVKLLKYMFMDIDDSIDYRDIPTCAKNALVEIQQEATT